MSIPLRIQRKRTKGWRMPDGAIYVGRPTKWGNPYKIEREGDAATVVAKYRLAWEATIRSSNMHPRHPLMPFGKPVFLGPLIGKNLACFCKLCDRHKDGKPLNVHCSDCAPCHADVLGELANGFVCEAAA